MPPTVQTNNQQQNRNVEKRFGLVGEFKNSFIPGQSLYATLNISDFDGWKYSCAQVIFDSDPAPIGRSVPAQLEEMSQAVIREETLSKRKSDILNHLDYEGDQEYEYKMVILDEEGEVIFQSSMAAMV